MSSSATKPAWARPGTPVGDAFRELVCAISERNYAERIARREVGSRDPEERARRIARAETEVLRQRKRVESAIEDLEDALDEHLAERY